VEIVCSSQRTGRDCRDSCNLPSPVSNAQSSRSQEDHRSPTTHSV
jgi:hypothetical protein